MFPRAVSLLIALVVACLPLGVLSAASTRAAADCCAGHAQGPACPGCPTVPDGGAPMCCAGAVLLAPFAVPAGMPAPTFSKARRSECTDDWTVRRERPDVPPPRDPAEV